MASLSELQAYRAALEAARFNGARVVEYGEGGSRKRVEYATDDELRAALAEVERRIAALSGAQPVRTVYITASKGLGR